MSGRLVLSLLAPARLLRIIRSLAGLAGDAPPLLVGATNCRRGNGSAHVDGSIALALALSGVLLGSLARVVGSQLLSDGSLLVRVSGSSGVLERRNGNVVCVGVVQGLLIRHIFGKRVAANLVRVDTSVVETEVVLVSSVPAKLLSFAHLRPATLALSLDSTLGSILTEVTGDD